MKPGNHRQRGRQFRHERQQTSYMGFSLSTLLTRNNNSAMRRYSTGRRLKIDDSSLSGGSAYIRTAMIFFRSSISVGLMAELMMSHDPLSSTPSVNHAKRRQSARPRQRPRQAQSKRQGFVTDLLGATPGSVSALCLELGLILLFTVLGTS